MFCRCGQEMDNLDKFCRNCGRPAEQKREKIKDNKSSKNPCPICNAPIKGLFKARIKDDQPICSDCASRAYIRNGSMKFMSVEDFKEHLAYRQKNYDTLNSLNITHEIQASVMPTYYFRVDVHGGHWYIIKKNDTSNVPVYKFSEIMDYELIENGNPIVKGGGVGKAVVGGLLFGGAGAIVGASTAQRASKTVVDTMKLKITINNPYNDFVEIDFLQSLRGVKQGSVSYNSCAETATKIISLLEMNLLK